MHLLTIHQLDKKPLLIRLLEHPTGKLFIHFSYSIEKEKEKQIKSRIAPEMFSSAGYDNKVDIWALGIVGIECATGHPPYYKKSAQEVFRIICKDTKGPTLESNAEREGQYIRYTTEFRHFLLMALEPSSIKRLNASNLLQTDFLNKFAQEKKFVIDHMILKIPFDCIEQQIDIDYQCDDLKDRIQTTIKERGLQTETTILDNIRNFFR